MPTLKNIRKLATLCGIQTSYKNGLGKRVQPPKDTLIEVLKAMDIKVDSDIEVKKAINELKKKEWEKLIEPVIVAWNGKLQFNITISSGTRSIEIFLGGKKKRFDVKNLDTIKEKTLNKKNYKVKQIEFEKRLLPGYYNLKINTSYKKAKAMVISAPLQCYCHDGKYTGYFAPLYSLSTKTSIGAGFRELEKLSTKAKKNKKNLVATLPLTPSFIDTLYNPSPYSPVSLLLLNEFYISLEKIPELKQSREALKIMRKKDYKEKVKKIKNSSKVNYTLQMEVKRKVLEELSEHFFSQKPKKRYEEFRNFLRKKPFAVKYAKFRAKVEKEQKRWEAWDKKSITKNDYEEKTYLYYLYCQWIAYEQLKDVTSKAKEKGVYMYLDLPVGVEPAGFDVWRQKSFVKNMRVGAPPDPMFTWGQNWGFRPHHPDRIREEGYSHFINALRNHMEFASFLRIDHVMGLHRQYWIPEGMPASKGTYTSYNSEELYAILSVESHRHKCTVIGENLGTVPEYVNKAMKKHNLLEFSVFQFMIGNELPQFKERTVACLNTHDTPTFAGFLKGKDINMTIGKGLIEKKLGQKNLKERQEGVKKLKSKLQQQGYKIKTKKELMEAITLYLIKSQAKVVLINLQDLFLDETQQNLPGTTKGNWVKKLPKTIENIKDNLVTK